MIFANLITKRFFNAILCFRGPKSSKRPSLAENASDYLIPVKKIKREEDSEIDEIAPKSCKYEIVPKTCKPESAPKSSVSSPNSFHGFSEPDSEEDPVFRNDSHDVIMTGPRRSRKNAAKIRAENYKGSQLNGSNSSNSDVINDNPVSQSQKKNGTARNCQIAKPAMTSSSAAKPVVGKSNVAKAAKPVVGKSNVAKARTNKVGPSSHPRVRFIMECYATHLSLWRAAIFCGILWVPLPPPRPFSLSFLLFCTRFGLACLFGWKLGECGIITPLYDTLFDK